MAQTSSMNMAHVIANKRLGMRGSYWVLLEQLAKLETENQDLKMQLGVAQNVEEDLKSALKVATADNDRHQVELAQGRGNASAKLAKVEANADVLASDSGSPTHACNRAETIEQRNTRAGAARPEFVDEGPANDDERLRRIPSDAFSNLSTRPSTPARCGSAPPKQEPERVSDLNGLCLHQRLHSMSGSVGATAWDHNDGRGRDTQSESPDTESIADVKTSLV